MYVYIHIHMYIMCIYKEIKQKYVLHNSVRQYNTHTHRLLVFSEEISNHSPGGKSVERV